MPAPLLQLRDIHLTFGGSPLLEGAELQVSEGDRLALVGRNGSGKSTLLKIAAGLAEADGGERFADPAATIRYLPQEPDLSGFASARAYAEAGLAPGDDPYRPVQLLNALGLTGEENPANLSGGEVRRAALARALAPSPDILLLDEPTNHLDLPAIEWLESELAGLRSALVLISHDRRFLERLSRAVVWLDRGRTRRLEQGFGAFESWRDEQLAQEELDRHKLDRQIAREEDWLRYGVTARRKRNQGRLARLQTLRRERREQVKAAGAASMVAAEGARSGSKVIEARAVAKAYGGVPVVRDVTIRIMRGDRVGVAGANGTGKTTLLKLLTGRLEPDSGTVEHGANVEVAWLDQQRAALDPDASVTDTLTGGTDTLGVGGRTRHVAGYLRDFLFTPQQMRQKVRALSGGERGRLLLARAFAQPSTLLVLDEPTNDLDLETLDVLQEALNAYEGTVLLVSHDRDFLDRVATSVLMAEGNGRFVEYAGGYSDMVAQRGSGVVAKEAPKTAARAEPSTTPVAARSASRKMSFKDKHALETLPQAIANLQAEMAALEAKLADGAFYVRDPKGFDTASQRLSAARAEHDAAEHRWLELELLREALEA